MRLPHPNPNPNPNPIPNPNQVCLPLYLLTDHRFVRRGVLPSSLWWHIGFSWSVRAAAIAGHVWLCFWSFAEFLG